MDIKEKLKEIVGADNYSDNPNVLLEYSKDFSLEPSGMPNYLVKPQNSQEVQKIIQSANEFLIPVVPVSSKVHFYGATIPKQGGIILDLTRMNKILEIDTLNRRIRLEAGATWEQVTNELDKNGYRIMMPLLPHSHRSVVIDHIERETITNTVYDYGEPLQSMEVVWPTGEIFRTGSASVNGYPDSPSRGANPSGPGIDFYRFVQSAQGTMGVITWANLKIATKPTIDKIYFSPVNDLDRAIEFLYRILRIRIGQECLLLNNINLASIISEDISRDFEKFRSILPPWTLILVISALKYRPEEKIKYEEDALKSVLKNEFKDLEFANTIPGITALDKKVMPMLRKPWPANQTYWKNRYKGGCQNLFFIIRPNMATSFINTVYDIATLFDYPLSEIGGYIQPIEHNRACYVEFNFFYDPENNNEREMIKSLYYKTAEVLLNEGAVFTRPYGKFAQIIYDKAGDYKTTLMRVKKIFDPNNIMNPGKLCF